MGSSHVIYCFCRRIKCSTTYTITYIRGGNLEILKTQQLAQIFMKASLVILQMKQPLPNIISEWLV